MILEGIRLMAVGMFTVFAFLTLLVGLMRGSAAFFEANAHRFLEDAPEDKRSVRSGTDEDVAVALALAEALQRGQKV
jgi:Na+-transporting methylmalonyl-CoA/oxaloacetate decarboxylase gamma subunit